MDALCILAKRFERVNGPMLYKVTVCCWYEGLHGRPRREFVRVLVDERDREAAHERAVEFAEGNAPCDQKWLRFEWREVSTVSLPKMTDQL